MAESKKFTLDVFVKDDSVERAQHYVNHVQKLFDVEIKFSLSTAKPYMPVPGQWLDVEGQRMNVIKAREYIKGLSNPEEVVRLRFPPPVYELICGKEGEDYFKLEQETSANIVFYSADEIEISGSISGVTKASLVIEDIIKRFIEEHTSNALEFEDGVHASIEEDSGIYVKCHGLDCLYDNHSEFSENRSSILTIDEEFDDNSISLSTDSLDEKDSKCGTCIQRNSQEILDSELMEYAKKLGYSEGQVKSAMKKLGPETVDQNELLHELIKASNSIRDGKLLGEDVKTNLSNFYESVTSQTNSDNSFLRHVVVDGSNVAMSHGKNQVFSCRGIAIVVNWFQKRGHGVTVFVPNWRKEASKPDTPITDQEILTKLNDDGVVSFTPSRRIGGKLIQCYDDRYIVRLAVETDGIIVSNDHFRDIQKDIPQWKEFINNRLLMYTFAGDIFMPPDDPLGRQGPALNEFLRKNVERRGMQYCPYGRKCTFGPKCKFYHPEKRNSGTYVKKPLPPPPQTSSSRPRSDPGQNLNPNSDGKQRPISLPNLEQLYISPPTSLHRYIYIQTPNHAYQRPVSAPPFPENNNTQYSIYAPNSESNLVSRSPADVVQKQQQQQQNRKFGGDYSHFNPNAIPGQYLVLPQRRPPSGEYIPHINVDSIGRPLSSDYGSRPSSGEYSYSSAGSRPPSGEYGNNSRPSSGDYSVQWGVTSAYQRPIQYNSHQNFYPMKSYYKSRGAQMLPETKEEPRQSQNSLKIDMVDKLRELYPDQYDKILLVLRTYPEIKCVEDAVPYINECIKA